MSAQISKVRGKYSKTLNYKIMTMHSELQTWKDRAILAEETLARVLQYQNYWNVWRRLLIVGAGLLLGLIVGANL